MNTSEQSGYEIEIPYGTQSLTARVPAGRLLGTLDVSDTPPLKDRDRAIRDAIENPIGLDRDIFRIVSPGETVAIVVPDSFRTTRVEQVLPVLIGGLIEAGIAEGDITLVYATGTHRGPTPDEERRILGDGIYERFKGQAFTHDPRDEDNPVYGGTQGRGTRSCPLAPGNPATVTPQR